MLLLIDLINIINTICNLNGLICFTVLVTSNFYIVQKLLLQETNWKFKNYINFKELGDNKFWTEWLYNIIYSVKLNE